MIIYCKSDGSVQSVPAVIPQGSLREPVTIIAPAPSAICSLRIMPASHEALDPVIATGMEIDGENRVYSLHLPPTVTEWAGVCRYQVVLTDQRGRQTASYAGTFTVQRGAIDPDLLPADTEELGQMSLADLYTLLSSLQTAGISAQSQIDEIQRMIDAGEIGGTPETDPHPAPQSINPVQSGGTYSAFSRVLALILAAALPSALASSFSTYISKADAYIRNAYYIDQPTAEQVAAYESAYTALRTALNLAPVTIAVNASGSGATVSPVSVTRGQAAVITITPESGKTLTEFSATMGGEELPSMTLDNGSVIVYTPAGVPATADISVTYTAEVRTDPLLSLTINGTAYRVDRLPHTVAGLTIDGTYSDSGSGSVTVTAVSGYRLGTCHINGVATTTYTAQDEDIVIIAQSIRTPSVTVSATNCTAYANAGHTLIFDGGVYDYGTDVTVYLAPASGYTLDESDISVSGLDSVTIIEESGDLVVRGTLADDATITATAVSNSVTLTVNMTNAYIRLGDSAMVLQPITPGMALPTHRGQILIMEVEPEDGYIIRSVVGDGVNLGDYVESGAKRIYSITVTGKADGTATITATASADTEYDYTIDDDGYIVITAAPYTIDADGYIVID